MPALRAQSLYLTQEEADLQNEDLFWEARTEAKRPHYEFSWVHPRAAFLFKLASLSRFLRLYFSRTSPANAAVFWLRNMLTENNLTTLLTFQLLEAPC